MMSRALVVDGKLTVPLFHGTSSLFYDSILKTGLGARNIIDDLGFRAVIAKLMDFEDLLESAVSNWLLEKPLLLKIVQPPLGQNRAGHGVFNFRYGGAYVTPSRQTAARYALLNPCGSEALASTLKVLDALVSKYPELAAEKEFSRIRAFANRPRVPILIEAQSVPEESLRTEQGGDRGPVIELIESALRDPDIYDDLVAQSNFELVSPVPPSQLRFYRIVEPKSGHDSFENLRLAPM